MFRSVILMLLVVLGAPVMAEAQGWDPRTEDAKTAKYIQKADKAIDRFKASDPTLQVFFDEAFGYAVFPRIIKGAALIGGADGQGILYEGGEAKRRAHMSQYTIGLQLGGKRYSELIFFRDRDAFERFLDGEFALSAQASAIIATEGAAATVDYADDVAIFTLDDGGALVEASVGGQTFWTTELR